MTKDFATRAKPPEDDDEWQYVWQAVDMAHKGWPIVRIWVAFYSNWKAIGIAVFLGLSLGGKELLTAWGWL